MRDRKIWGLVGEEHVGGLHLPTQPKKMTLQLYSGIVVYVCRTENWGAGVLLPSVYHK